MEEAREVEVFALDLEAVCRACKLDVLDLVLRAAARGKVQSKAGTSKAAVISLVIESMKQTSLE